MSGNLVEFAFGRIRYQRRNCRFFYRRGIAILSRYDPRPTLEKVKIPVLALNGENDLQVSSKENLANLFPPLSKSEGTKILPLNLFRNSIISRQMMSGQTFEHTTYIKGKRQRTEQNMGSMQMINLTQCDLKRAVQMNPAAKTYLIDLFDQNQVATPKSAIQTGN